MISGTCSKGSVAAISLVIMNGTFELILPSACSSKPQGSVRTILKVESSTTSMLAVTAASCWPMPSRLPQRAIEAMLSSEVTGEPSCHFRPGRSLMV